MNQINGSGLQKTTGTTNTLAAPGTSGGTDGSRDGRVTKKVAREFEALFIGMMVKSMRESVGKDSLTGGGRGEEVYGPMLDQEYANAMAQQGGIGLATMIEQQLNGPLKARMPAGDAVAYAKGNPESEHEVSHENR